MPRPKKNKKPPTILIIPRLDEAGEVREPYRIMEELIPKHHDHLAEAKIAMAWNTAWKADVDGHLVLGKCIKVPALVHRHGLYKSDLEEFARTCIQKAKTPLLLRADQNPAAVQG